MEVTFRELEVTRLNVQPGEVLIVKVSGPEFDDNDTFYSFQNALKQVFPANKVFAMRIDDNHKITFEVAAIKEGLPPLPDPLPPSTATDAQVEELLGKLQQPVDCSIPENYCNSCGCGKKERIESERASKTSQGAYGVLDMEKPDDQE